MLDLTDGAAAERAARRIKAGSKSFAAAARVLPGRKRASIQLLYSWCRHCDDFVDDEHLGFPAAQSALAPAEKIATLRTETLAALRGQAPSPEFDALRRVAAEHAIPDRYPLEFIDGMAMDAFGAHFDTINDTLHYCYHVAGVVGVMSAIVLGVRDQPTLERACDLGIAFQLTNIARDIVDDARRGRVYLPADWLAEARLPVPSLDLPERREDLFKVVQRLLDVSDAYYRSALAGIARLPFRSAWAVAMARRVYRGIGEEVRRRGAKSWDQRIVTSPASKVIAGMTACVEAGVLMLHGAQRAGSREGLWTPTTLEA